MARRYDRLEKVALDDIYFPVELGSILGMLYDAYTELNNTETCNVQRTFKELYGLLDHATSVDTEKTVNVVCDFCRVYEKAGFVNGIQIGIRLAQEANIR